jgi:transposase
MKSIEKGKAIILRKKGHSIKQIAKEIGVSKASVSMWVRAIKLKPNQLAALKLNEHSRSVIDKRRITRLRNEEEKRSVIMKKSGNDIHSLSKTDLKNIGISLYWAEGRKRGGRFVSFSNSDPKMIKIIMRFFREVCEVGENRFRGHIHTHSHLSVAASEKYWSQVSSIPLNQFYKTYCKPSISSKGKMDSLPYGTLDINVCDTALFLRIMGWIEKVSFLLLEKKL